MKPLACPKCEGTLKAIIYQNIEIDRCDNCLGIWFDSLEAEELKNRQGSESIDKGDLNEKSLSDPLTEPICCPRCEVTMIKMLDLDQYPIWYEICSQCQGIWFDAGEFKKFKSNFLPKGFFTRAKQAFSFKKKRS
jgi:Zn-finger nucleic acid-binding protein